MQYDNSYEGTEHFMAVTLSGAKNVAEGETDHLVRQASTQYRGRLVLVSPVKEGGCTEAFADLVDVKAVAGGYLWKFANVEKMIPFPARKCGMRGEVWDLYYTENTLVAYPQNARLFLKKGLLDV